MLQALSRKRLNRKEIAMEMENLVERVKMEAKMQVIAAQTETKLVRAEMKLVRAQAKLEAIKKQYEEEWAILLIKNKVFTLLKDDRKVSLRGAIGR